ncbi:vWA domain-containing protein [Haliangium sp.]|uniref:vWA domain-containing protein n=1 Tax=Haliangium sp. TaxID=2663208 RepID=UPI003D0D05E9
MRVELLTDVADAGMTVYLLVRLEAVASTAAQRPPVNLALAIDRSSSMRGPRIAHAVAAARRVVEQLDERDRLSIVTFDASARSLFGPANMTPEAKQRLDSALAGLRTGVGTNLAAGIKKGAEAVRSGYVRGAVARLVLLTDGQPSLGITDPSRLCALAEKEAGRGVSLTTMGLGEGFDDELLAELAHSGRGGFHYLASAADIPGAFGRELAGVFAIAATQTELGLRPAEHVAAAELVHRLPSRPMDDGLVVELGELAAASPRQVLFRLTRMPDSDDPRCGTLTVTYRTPDGNPGDAHLIGIDAPTEANEDHRRAITLERTRLAVASAVDTAWARRASGDSMRALAALGEIKAEVLQLEQSGEADGPALAELMADIAEAEGAVVKSSAERERARRSMRERSHITLLGQSAARPLPPPDDD